MFYLTDDTSIHTAQWASCKLHHLKMVEKPNPHFWAITTCWLNIHICYLIFNTQPLRLVHFIISLFLISSLYRYLIRSLWFLAYCSCLLKIQYFIESFRAVRIVLLCVEQCPHLMCRSSIFIGILNKNVAKIFPPIKSSIWSYAEAVCVCVCIYLRNRNIDRHSSMLSPEAKF